MKRMLLLAIWATLGGLAALIMAWVGAMAPFGWQDQSGFHFGESPGDFEEWPH